MTLIAATQLSASSDPYRGYMQLGTKTSCCGGQDCAPLPDGMVKAVHGGYQVDGWGFIENSRTQPGFDMHYHLCHSKTTLFCFLTPAPGI